MVRSGTPAESPYIREPGYAERYRDRRFASGSGPRTHDRELRALRRLLGGAPTVAGPWLDVPSGAGRLSGELPPPVVQVDRDPAMVRACPGGRARACASALALPFADRAFAGVLCMRLLQHLPDGAERMAVLRELARVAEGVVIVSFFHAVSLQHLRRVTRTVRGRRRSRRCAVTWGRFRRELLQAGLEPVATAPLNAFVSEQWLVAARPSGR